MFIKRQQPEKTQLDHAIDATFDAYHPENDDAPRQIQALKELHSLKPATGFSKFNPDTILVVAGNIVGILLIVDHERTRVLGSKAVNFIMKAR